MQRHDQAIDDPQTEAEAAVPVLSRGLLESPEDSCPLVRRYAHAAVLHVEPHGLFVGSKLKGDGSAHAKLDRIDEQVLDDLLHRERIPKIRNPVFDLKDERTALTGGQDLVAVSNRTCECGKVGEGRLQPEVAGLKSADVQQPGRSLNEVVNEALHPLH